MMPRQALWRPPCTAERLSPRRGGPRVPWNDEAGPSGLWTRVTVGGDASDAGAVRRGQAVGAIPRQARPGARCTACDNFRGRQRRWREGEGEGDAGDGRASSSTANGGAGGGAGGGSGPSDALTRATTGVGRAPRPAKRSRTDAATLSRETTRKDGVHGSYVDDRGALPNRGACSLLLPHGRYTPWLRSGAHTACLVLL